MKEKEKKLTVEEFVLRAIESLRKGDRETIHTVYSGMNQAFREYFPDKDPVAEVDALVKAGKISFRLARGGAVIGKPGVVINIAGAKDTLKKMGL